MTKTEQNILDKIKEVVMKIDNNYRDDISGGSRKDRHDKLMEQFFDLLNKLQTK